jgi:inorganic pyrophosphatase
MANINHEPSKYMLNLLHVLPPYAEKENKIANCLVEVSKGSLNKYELITEAGVLKLDRVGYSSMSYPFTYGAIPQTWDHDNDPLDIEIIGVTEWLIPGSLVEVRVIGVMKYDDGGEVDDKIIAVLSADKRMDHITDVSQLGEYFIKETTHYWEHYKDLKKPGTGKVNGFFGPDEAMKVINDCAERYQKDYAPKVK